MKKLFTILAAIVAGTVIIASNPPSSSADTDTVVICDAYPSQPWLCANGSDSLSQWDYLFGFNFGYDYDDQIVFNSANVESDTITSSNLSVGSVICRGSRGTKYMPGTPAFIRGSGTISCPVPVTIRQTVWLFRSRNPYPQAISWMAVAGRSAQNRTPYSSAANPRKRCVPTVNWYNWKVQQLAYVTRAGYVPAKQVASSIKKIYHCK